MKNVLKCSFLFYIKIGSRLYTIYMKGSYTFHWILMRNLAQFFLHSIGCDDDDDGGGSSDPMMELFKDCFVVVVVVSFILGIWTKLLAFFLVFVSCWFCMCVVWCFFALMVFFWFLFFFFTTGSNFLGVAILGYWKSICIKRTKFYFFSHSELLM